MKINLICVGKDKNKLLSSEILRFQKLLGPFCKLEIKELKDSKASKTFAVENCKIEEGQRIIKSLEGVNIALDENGENLNSRGFAKL